MVLQMVCMYVCMQSRKVEHTWMEKKPSELTFPLSSAMKLLKSSLSTPPSAMKAFSAASSSWAICISHDTLHNPVRPQGWPQDNKPLTW